MTKTEIHVLSQDRNSWVIRLPGREYPGVVIQGDSLKILFDLADEISDLAPPSGELRESVDELRENLKTRLALYEAALKEHGITLPYSRAVS